MLNAALMQEKHKMGDEINIFHLHLLLYKTLFAC